MVNLGEKWLTWAIISCIGSILSVPGTQRHHENTLNPHQEPRNEPPLDMSHQDPFHPASLQNSIIAMLPLLSRAKENLLGFVK